MEKTWTYVTVKVVDKDGNLCPTDNRQINFSVKGTGKYRAAANGDPTNLEQFHLPKMHAFNGMLTAILARPVKLPERLYLQQKQTE